MQHHSRNVQERVHQRMAEMIAVADSFLSLPGGVRAALIERGFVPRTHALLQYSRLPECCPNSYVGTFVTPDHRFIEFEVETSEDGTSCTKVAHWADVTDATEVNFRKPGVGKTFGAIGLEVLAVLQALGAPTTKAE